MTHLEGDNSLQNGLTCVVPKRMKAVPREWRIEIESSAKSLNVSITSGMQRKLASNLSTSRLAGMEFIPLVMETFGNLAEESISILHSLGTAFILLGTKRMENSPNQLITGMAIV